MRRALAVAVVLLLALPVAAGAQGSAQGEAVVGGGSFANAPLLEPGAYRDTILPGERLYYAIRLQAGQQLRVRAKLDVEPGEVDDEVADGFSIGMQTPLREVVIDTDEDRTGNSTVGNVDDAFDVVYPKVVAPSAAGQSGAYMAPGVYYPSLYLIADERKPAKVELPVEFELEVIGDPQPDASPEPTPGKKATPAPEKDSGDDGDGTPAGAVAGIGLAGLLVGLIGGGFAARRR
jgi:Ca-activated chloride channel family protein